MPPLIKNLISPPFIRSALPIALLTAIILISSPATANAAKTKTLYVNKGILIKSVNVAAQTVEILAVTGHTTQTYKIDSVTIITVRGAPGKITDLKFGMQVLSLVERDDVTLDAITVDTADTFKTKK